jgi:hypothetical protein
VAIDRGVAVADHVQEDVGIREQALDSGGGIGIGRRGIVAAERLGLGADGGLRGGDIVRSPDGGREADPECDEQDEDAHGFCPVAPSVTRRRSK